ncbi:MAG: hypothetical protein KJO07_00370 [Deltaproteobacteria bacterium]|nr:hypothetical protein [Deltaproteobacteria bacterium]
MVVVTLGGLSGCGLVSYDSLASSASADAGAAAAEWVRWASSDDSVALDIGVDGAGRATVLMRLEGQLVGEDVPELTSTARASVALRFDPEGNIIDHQLFEATSSFELRAIDVAADGSWVATGSLGGTSTIAETTLDSGSNQGVIVVVADASGSPAQAVLFSGGGANAQGHSIAGSATGAIAVGGLFGDQVQLTGLTIGGAQSQDIAFHGLLADVGGAAIWGLGLDSPDAQAGSVTLGIGMGEQDRTCITGYFEGPTDFGGGPVGDVVGGNQAGDAFVAEYLGDGSLSHLELLGSTAADRGFGAVAVAGGCVVSGRLCGPNSYTDHVGACDGFVARVTQDAGVEWSRGIAGTELDVVFGLDVGPSGTVYAGGTFTGSASLGQLTVERADGSVGGFAAALDPDGTPRWLRSIEGDDVAVDAVAVTQDEERLLVAGHFVGTLRISGRTISSDNRATFVWSLPIE